MLKKTLISAALLGAVAVAAPASAQYYNGYNNGYNNQYRGNDVRQQIYQLQNRVQRASQNGTISRREAYRLQQQVNLLQRLERRYAYNGLSRWEREDLQRRVFGLRQQIREDRRDGRYDRDDRYDRNDRWDRDDDD